MTRGMSSRGIPGELPAKCRRVPCLDPVIELVEKRHLELLNDADEVDALASARVIGEEARELTEKLDVVGERLANARTLRLDDDGPPVSQRCFVHLTEAGAPQRLGVELTEQLADAGAELLLDGLLDHRKGERIDIVLKVLELPDVRFGEKVGAGGQHLSELDVRRTELDEALAECASTLDDAVTIPRRLLPRLPPPQALRSLVVWRSLSGRSA